MSITSESSEDNTNTTPLKVGTPTPRAMAPDEFENVAEQRDDSESRSDTPEYGDERLQLYTYVDAQQQRIENQIIFAGLFSALVTVHIFSFRWLRSDDASAAARLLAETSPELDALVGHSTSALPVQHMSLAPNPRGMRITAYMFTSVLLCLSTIVCGTFSLRWWREYLRYILLPQEVVYDRRFKRKMVMVMSLFPIMLQLSVILVLAGVLELLWEWNDAVAAVATAMVGLITLIAVPGTAATLVQNLYDLFTAGRPTR